MDEAPHAMEHVQNICCLALDYEKNEDEDCVVLEVRWSQVSFKTRTM